MAARTTNVENSLSDGKRKTIISAATNGAWWRLQKRTSTNNRADWERALNTSSVVVVVATESLRYFGESGPIRFQCTVRIVCFVTLNVSVFRMNCASIRCSVCMNEDVNKKTTKFHSECVGVRGMMNSNSEAAWCGVRDENSFYKLMESASIARHSIRGFKAIHFYVEHSWFTLNNNRSSYLRTNERKP